MPTYKINLKDQTATSLNGITFKLTETNGEYFRIATDVIVDGESLGDMLVEAGMAVKYNGGKSVPSKIVGFTTRNG